MPLTSFSLQNTLSWQLQSTAPAPFSALSQGPDTLQFGSGVVDLTTFNQILVANYTLAHLATQVIDLFSFTNLVGEAVSFDSVYMVSVLVGTGTGGNVLVQPNDASNPLQWFFNGTTEGINLPNGAGFTFLNPLSGAGQVVDATHRSILLTSNGGSSVTVKVAVAGKA